ncbi:MAG: PDZ domain-containing protein, partial [Clostridiales bacterium]|nr:PDZ domain-containing protein [Clostridiales bacterium]
MENRNVKIKENVIISVEKGSIAEELGIEPGDVLVAVNGKEIQDVFDYR